MANPATSRAPRAGAGTGRASGLFGREVELVLAAHRPGERPRVPLPALAVLGRSNVGKSSLLNALLGVKVARVSQTPGRTQALYWYLVDGRLHVVDCPGYGFAKAAKEKREIFAGLIEELLLGEPRPAAALLLVDGRLEPQESDRSMALFLRNAGVPTVIAATKWDAVKPSERVRRLRRLAGEYQDESRSLQPVSAETGENLPLLLRRIADALRSPEPDASAKEKAHASS